MSLQLLGGLSVNAFLARHWQKSPLVVRGAIPGFRGIVPIPELLRLAARDDVESRLVARRGRRWELRHGPIARRELDRMPPRNWTVLVHGLNLRLDAAERLLERFAFLPRARIDDIMVSYAAPGGGVGPHVDSYDVFLLQGEGRRRWRIAPARDRTLLPGAPLAVLAHFEPRREWILEPGDMLYLPPGFAHDGVALERCTTYSIGFRAPSAREIASALLGRLEERLSERAGDRRYADRGARAPRRVGEVPAALVDFARAAAGSVRVGARDAEIALGEHLSEPKPLVAFDRPARPVALARFGRLLEQRGAALDRRSILLYRGRRFYINGESIAVPAAEAPPLRVLADTRALPPGRAGASLRKLLHGWYVHGWLQLQTRP